MRRPNGGDPGGIISHNATAPPAHLMTY
ncbi:hypothetical protein FRAHR75_120088 [Frankia sp. Hr75.2]|nr:hypothetical protein FRAHR75_120088 [Frankia sp. Hr75.2]SQD96508.1 hypothetical protein FMEAI12_3640131 [Parafrankia sp. Ea1.12]